MRMRTRNMMRTNLPGSGLVELLCASGIVFKVIRGEASLGAPSVIFRRLVAKTMFGGLLAYAFVSLRPSSATSPTTSHTRSGSRLSGPAQSFVLATSATRAAPHQTPSSVSRPPAQTGSNVAPHYHVSSVLSVHNDLSTTRAHVKIHLDRNEACCVSIRINREAYSAVVALIIRHVMRREARSSTGRSCTSYGLGCKMQTFPASLATIAQGR